MSQRKVKFREVDLDERFMFGGHLYIKVSTCDAVRQAEHLLAFGQETVVDACEEQSPAERILDALVDEAVIGDRFGEDGPRRDNTLRVIRDAIG